MFKPTGVHETATQQCCMRLMIFICEGTAVPGKELNTKHARHEEVVSRKGKEHVDASGSQEFHFVKFMQQLIWMLRLNYALHITDSLQKLLSIINLSN